jgi:hypothetical protein
LYSSLRGRQAPWTGRGHPPSRQPSDNSKEADGCTSAARSLGGRGGAVSNGTVRVTIRLAEAAMPIVRERMRVLGAPTLSRYVRQLLALDLRWTQAAAVNPVGRPPAKPSRTAQAAFADAATTSCPPPRPPPSPPPACAPPPEPPPEPAPFGWCPVCGTRLVGIGSYHERIPGKRCNKCDRLFDA